VALLADAPEDGGWSSAGRSIRPAFLLPTPEPISVIAEIPDGPPARFTWRRVPHRVVRAEGPERIAPEWWRKLDQEEETQHPALGRIRDYYRIESDQGGRFWVFRAGLFGGETDEDEPSWYLHGLFG
jgi:protein ImuB